MNDQWITKNNRDNYEERMPNMPVNEGVQLSTCIFLFYRPLLIKYNRVMIEDHAIV